MKLAKLSVTKGGDENGAGEKGLEQSEFEKRFGKSEKKEREKKGLGTKT